MVTKRLIQLLIALVIIIVLCVIGLTLFVDPNRYKDLIATKIEEKIHRPVAINGDIHWSFWPGVGLSLEKVHISEPHSTATFADIETIKLSARLIPLLSKQIEIKNLAVENTKVYLPKKINLNIISLDTELYINMPSKSYEAQEGSVKMTVEGLDGFSQAQLVKLTFDKLLFDLNTGHLTADNLKAQLGHSKIVGNLTVTTLHPFKAQGDVTIDTITVSGMTFTQTQIHIDANNNIIRFAPLKTQLPSGSLQSTIILNMQQSTPRWDIDATLNNMLLNSAKFTGHVNGHTKVNASGFDRNTFLQTLNGNANFNITDGTLNNIDLGYWLSVGESMLISAKNITTLAIDTAQAAVGKNNTNHTTFKEMSGSFNIQQGIAHNNDLKVSSDTIFANGKGIIDLPKQQVNYTVNVGRQGSNSQIPLKVTGDLKSPNVGIDRAGIQKLLLQGVKNGLADTMTGGVIPAIGAGEAIVNSVTGNHSNNNNTNTNTQSSPEQTVKDTIKGLFN